MISVVIPNYNKSHYLSQAVNSVLMQENVDLEVIVVDDCSTDDSADILQSINDPRVRVIFNSINMGVSVSRNLGAMAAKGEYISFLDSDDFYTSKSKLDSELKCFLSSAAENLCVYSIVNIVDDSGNFINRTKEFCYSGDFYKAVVTRSGDLPRDFLIKRDFFIELGGFSSGVSLFEDWDFKIRMSRSVLPVFTGETGSAYRQTGVGLSDKGYVLLIVSILNVFRKNTIDQSLSERIGLFGSLLKNLILSRTS
ncbi:glycosyltransferase family 2 protein [Amphritea pacifica]|uniref:Glycosyltransferase n=1 Tax=Amphritea pacifica TaxID=2811233 RepID=A0ABS2W575_9GAMM|nr:glycosyltransferase [Amphritea pacifica]MBN0986870.1 glycosyltransferase [Amphritea pacifica]